MPKETKAAPIAGRKKSQRQKITPLKKSPRSEEIKVRLKKPPTFLPRSLGIEVLAIKIKLIGIIADPDIPAKTLAIKRKYKLGARPAKRFAKERTPRQEKSIFLQSRLRAKGPYNSAARP
jgi:hypothetical protein